MAVTGTLRTRDLPQVVAEAGIRAGELGFAVLPGGRAGAGGGRHLVRSTWMQVIPVVDQAEKPYGE